MADDEIAMDSGAIKAAAAASTASYQSFADATRSVLDLLVRLVPDTTLYLAHLDRQHNVHRIVDVRAGGALGLHSNQATDLRESFDLAMAEGRAARMCNHVAADPVYGDGRDAAPARRGLLPRRAARALRRRARRLAGRRGPRCRPLPPRRRAALHAPRPRARPRARARVDGARRPPDGGLAARPRPRHGSAGPRRARARRRRGRPQRRLPRRLRDGRRARGLPARARPGASSAPPRCTGSTWRR